MITVKGDDQIKNLLKLQEFLKNNVMIYNKIIKANESIIGEFQSYKTNINSLESNLLSLKDNMKKSNLFLLFNDYYSIKYNLLNEF